MHAKWITAALLAGVLLLPVASQALVIVSFDLPGGSGTFSGSALEIPPGDPSFDIDVFIETDQTNVTGFNIQLDAEDSLAQTVAALLAFAFDAGLPTGVASGLPGSGTTLNVGNFPVTFPSGTIRIGTLTVDTTTLGPLGTLTLTAAPSNWVNSEGFFGDPLPFNNGGEILAVVTPEPATLSLTTLALAGLAMFAHRQPRRRDFAARVNTARSVPKS